MSVPKKKRTSGSSRRRRSHHALDKVELSKCSKCQSVVMPHYACANCGTYNDKKIK